MAEHNFNADEATNTPPPVTEHGQHETGHDELGQPVLPTPGSTDVARPGAPTLVGADPHDVVGAGHQRGESPGPVPPQNMDAMQQEPPAPPPPPRTDVKPVQVQPEIVGSHRVELEFAAPDPGIAAITKPAARLVTVGPGQSLSSIARLAYGDENKGHLIFEANRDTLKSPDVLQVGQTLVLPDDTDAPV